MKMQSSRKMLKGKTNKSLQEQRWHASGLRSIFIVYMKKETKHKQSFTVEVINHEGWKSQL
jgi:hypothetical protein